MAAQALIFPRPRIPASNRWTRALLLPVILIALVVGNCTVWSSASDPRALSVAIALPQEYKGERRITTYGQNPHFHVLVTNASGKPVKLWKEWCSWGAYNLSFNGTDENGKKFHLKKGVMAWTRNFPDACTLPPGESMVIDVNFSEPGNSEITHKLWEGFPWDRSETHRITLQAIYENRAASAYGTQAVWTGKLVSPPLPCVLYREE